MFESDILNKIVDFIKTSPIGATSSEVARFLTLNRITTTKYLAIAREKSLVDFKQYGMAKLWYIPVDINKESFFRDILIGITSKLNGSQRDIIKEVSLSTAKEISRSYKEFYKVEKLNKSQIIDSIMDIGNKIGGEFSLVENSDEVIIFKNKRNILGGGIKTDPMLAKTLLSDICGVMVGKNLGYCNIALKQSVSKDGPEDIIYIYLKKTDSIERKAIEYS